MSAGRESSPKAWLKGRAGWRVEYAGTKRPAALRKQINRKRAKAAKASRKANR